MFDRPVFKLIFFFSILVAIVIFLAYQFQSEKETTPCSPGGYPARCYQISEKMCDIVWQKSVETCKAYLQKFALPPGRLTGPITFQCQAASLDNAFAGARKSTPECERMFEDLKSWELRNDFK